MLKIVGTAGLLAAILVGDASAQGKRYDQGATDTVVKLGQTQPMSGPVSSMATVGRAASAYFQMINDQGGVNGRKIELLSVDDGYSPPKAFEQIRNLVENEKVLAIFGPFGTASNMAFQRYSNAKKIPSLFLSTSASRWGDRKTYPWTIAWSPSYVSEAGIYAKHILAALPDAKIAILKQHDEFGADYTEGFRRALGPKAQMIVAEATFEVSDATVDSQIITLKASGANVLMVFGTPKATAQALRKTAELGWTPTQFITHTSHAVSSVMKPVGFDKVQGVYSSAYLKDPEMPQWKDDPGVKQWSAWMDKYYPSGSRIDFLNVYGYTMAQAMVQVLKQAGDELTHENILKQALALDTELPMLLPGIRLKTSQTDNRPIEQMQLLRFQGENWVTAGDVVDLSP